MPEKERNKMETRDLPGAEPNLGCKDAQRTWEKNRRILNVSKEIGNIKKNQSGMKNAITEMKNTLEGINSRLDEAEDQVSDRKGKVVENTRSATAKEKKNL